ncbi:Actin cortical patch SUR7/pH-response regulator PalI [Metarhizium album ARSEF 1941]|uniref:Actin cortical patch SUR7/pH-response regulator PalI n=1 Tax=Metarhizium album (strain ARSEF 1941) TaxID=1081103 RepID=A0A0B2WZF9_METAS|nr:Actin cortical patch SUR7/pH-response regulator PalI [Metarhizium album ARSEF 1941]KHN98792.1 Actin cortical patch SUR7/pH-response regulator PalI [Metarhizium album ARSEF 1941]
MIRPATPLSVMLFVAFVLLIFSVISIPVTKFVPLGSSEDTKYGVFGYCQGDTCTGIAIGYPRDGALTDETQKFNLPSSVRHTLSAILVIHPVAALLTLIMLCLAIAAHLHTTSHSSRYLLVLCIFILITFVVCVAAFVIDVVLFIPHLAWGSYMVLAAAIVLAICTFGSFAMRRTIVSRKARKKRIAENAEMSGENYYNREGQVKPAPIIASQPTVPVVSGGNSGRDGLPAYATFESRNQRKDDQVSDERIPLTQRSPVERSATAVYSDMTNMGDASSLANSRQSPPRDRYGNPIHGPVGGYRGGRGGAYGRGGFDTNGVAGRGRGGGRGGYGPSPDRGGARGRGGYGPSRGAYGPRGGRGPPPMGAYAHMPQGQYDQKPPDRGWNGSQHGSATDTIDLPRAESPPPLPGQVPGGFRALEMNNTPLQPPENFYGHHNQLRDSDVDVVGMVGLQQGRPIPGGGRETMMTEASKYSTDEPQQYVPPRAAWNQISGNNSPRAASPGGMPGSRRDYYEDTNPRYNPAPPSGSVQSHPSLYPAPLYEEAPATGVRARSPAGSERSNFTSISQRGVNPRWEPHPPLPNQGPQSGRAAQMKQQRQDVLLSNNPDFQLPSLRGPGPKRTGTGMIPGSAYPGGAI